MTKNIFVFAFVLFTRIAQSVQAQAFKVGDYVDAFFGSWAPCRVNQPLFGNTYGVACGAAESRVQATAQYIRARTATSEDQRADAETAAALARQYGTRQPVTCANRTAPARGAPSVDQVRQYFIRDQERETSRFSLALVTSVKVQVVAPPSHAPNPQPPPHPPPLHPLPPSPPPPRRHGVLLQEHLRRLALLHDGRGSADRQDPGQRAAAGRELNYGRNNYDEETGWCDFSPVRWGGDLAPGPDVGFGRACI